MQHLLAAGAAPPFFVEIALLILASAIIAYVCYRIGIVPICVSCVNCWPTGM